MIVEADLLSIFKPHPKQLQFLLSWHRHELALTGVGWGKSWALTLKCLLAGLANTNSTVLLAGRTYKDLSQVLVPQLIKHVNTFHAATGVHLIRRWNKLDNRIDLLGGGSILLRSYQNNPDGLAGLNLSSAFVDEIEVTSADRAKVFGIISERCRVVDAYQTIAMASTPAGMSGIAKKFYHARLENDPDYHLTIGSSYDNPYMSESWKRALGAGASKSRFAQQVLGQICRPTNVVFPEATEDLLIDWDWRDHKECQIVIGIDWGTGNHNYALAAQVTPFGWVLCDELVYDNCPRGTFRKHLKTWIESFPQAPAVAATDRAAPTENSWLRSTFIDTYVRSADTAHEQYIKNGLEILRDQMSPAEGQPRLRVARTMRKPHSDSTAGIWQSLTTYRYRLDREGNPTDTPHKDDVTDHAMDALRYMYVKTRNMPELHGGSSLSMSGLGPDGDHPEGIHGKNSPHW